MIDSDKKKSSILKRDFIFISVIKTKFKRRRFNLKDRLFSISKTLTVSIKRQLT